MGTRQSLPEEHVKYSRVRSRIVPMASDTTIAAPIDAGASGRTPGPGHLGVSVRGPYGKSRIVKRVRETGGIFARTKR